jgi:hypothetical protein
MMYEIGSMSLPVWRTYTKMPPSQLLQPTPQTDKGAVSQHWKRLPTSGSILGLAARAMAMAMVQKIAADLFGTRSYGTAFEQAEATSLVVLFFVLVMTYVIFLTSRRIWAMSCPK